MYIPEFRPLHRRADDLIVAFERGEICSDARTEPRKALPQPCKAPLHRIAELGMSDIGEGVSAPAA
jgi:hypothetical protein